jgi:hypothetical protein
MRCGLHRLILRLLSYLYYTRTSGDNKKLEVEVHELIDLLQFVLSTSQSPFARGCYCSSKATIAWWHFVFAIFSGVHPRHAMFTSAPPWTNNSTISVFPFSAEM